MTNEQRKAIEFLEFYKQHCLKKEIENMDNYETIHDGDFVSKNLDTVLSLIKEQREKIEKYEKIYKEYDCYRWVKELNKKDKQIDLMAESIELQQYANIDTSNLDLVCEKLKCNKKCELVKKDCIKQYFADLVEKE